MTPIDDDDLDLLADHVAGLLEPAREARVTRLIGTDPAWAAAYADLTAAQPRLDEELATLSGRVPMPADVAARLDAVLAAQERPAAARTATVIRGPWRRVAGISVAVAAAVLAVFVGVNLFPTVRSANPTFSSGGAASTHQDAAAPDAASPYLLGGTAILRTGTDYTRQNLATAATVPAPPKAAAGAQNAEDQGRLADPTALSACTDAIVARYGGRPSLVDYARFEGQPALIVVLVDGGTRRVVAVGPSCGLPGSGAAVLYSVTE